jgi:hypothetical protein
MLFILVVIITGAIDLVMLILIEEYGFNVLGLIGDEEFKFLLLIPYSGIAVLLELLNDMDDRVSGCCC